MWAWVKNQLMEVEPFIAALGGIASVVIAFFAYEIDVKMQENQRLNSQVERAVKIAEGILSAKGFRDLQVDAFLIEAETERLFGELRETGQYDNAWKAAAAMVIAERMRNGLDTRIRNLLQHASRVYRCSNIYFSPSTGEPRVVTVERLSLNSLCDHRGVLMLTGESFMDLFVLLRPALFCDERLSSSIWRLQAVGLTYIEMQEERAVALAAAGMPSDSEPFDRAILTTFDDPEGTYCAVYRQALSASPDEQAAMQVQ